MLGKMKNVSNFFFKWCICYIQKRFNEFCLLSAYINFEKGKCSEEATLMENKKPHTEITETYILTL